MSYSIVSYVYVSFNRLITSFGRGNLLVTIWSLIRWFPLPLGAWDRLRHSLGLPYNNFS